MQTYVLAGGCFWCLDAVYRSLEGVTDVESGYTGGTLGNPDYETVCTGLTGHAEAVAVTFDPDLIPGDDILDVFFTLHDPRQSNRQGNDVGTQYRSAPGTGRRRTTRTSSPRTRTRATASPSRCRRSTRCGGRTRPT